MVIPDLNANYVFLVHCLLRHDIIEIKEGSIPYKGEIYTSNEEQQFNTLAHIQQDEQNSLDLITNDKLNPLLFDYIGEKDDRALFQLKDFQQITKNMGAEKRARFKFKIHV